MFKKILIPTDGSALATQAALEGIDYAKLAGAEVVCVFVAGENQAAVFDFSHVKPDSHWPTDEEYKHIQEHVKITYDILNKVYLSEEFKEVAEIASSHHEKYDGTGYFRKLAGENICLGGRILAVSDVFDAITSKRHYRDKMPIKDALSIIKNGSGKHFDPKIVESFFRIRLDRLVQVFLSEVDWKLQPEDELTLAKYTVGYLYDLITNKEPENFTPEEKKFFEMFNHYYNCKAGN